ncbi:MAG: 2,4-dihydroxyhept-2-ene-1,7-dioic acid aldolase [Dehalococcoidia bacterium]|nr:2,4-dihydroxyhept-2-ene-1,7-dioic acid aldolase [Dehalococcoidia bacterium]
MRTNQALAKLRSGGIVAGPLMVYDSPDLVGQVAHMGFDWVWLDWQHGQFTETTLNVALGRFLSFESVPLVRVRGHEPGVINRVLDMGALGVVVPMVQDAGQARAVVQAAYYPPLGQRSGGGVRLSLLGDGGTADYFAHANDEIMVIVMVETEAAIERVDEIMRVPGVDVVFIGPGDLMLDVKARGHDEARHEQLVQQVAGASRQTGTAAGYACGSRDDAERRIAQGFRFVSYSSDSQVFQAGFQQLRADARDW